MMNEHETIIQFNAQLDALMNSVPDGLPDNDEALAVARRLLQTDFSGESRIRDSLRNQLLNPGERHRKPARRFRMAAIIAAILLLLTVATLTVPPLRAFAQEVLRRVGFITLSNTLSDAEISLTYTPVPYTPTILPTLDLAEVQDKFRHTVYEPAYLPPGYESVSLTAAQTNVSTMYQLTSEACCRMLWLQQFRNVGGSPGDFGVGSAPIVDVMVGDVPGFWVENAPLGFGETAARPANLLVWKVDSDVFWLESMSVSDNQLLPLEEMLKVAESLQPQP